MDIEAALAAFRQAVADLEDARGPAARESAAERLAEHGSAIDEWLSSGGFLPAAWGG